MYSYTTKAGIFYIGFNQDDQRWHVIYQGENLGGYANPKQAADDVAGGHTYSPANGVDTATLGIPYDLVEWERARSK